jgi:hypothetical protein
MIAAIFMFILKCLVDKYTNSMGNKLYACFVDYKRAFDTLIHPGMLIKMLKSDIGGNLYHLIKHTKHAYNLLPMLLVYLSTKHFRINMWFVVLDLLLKPAWQSVNISLLVKWSASLVFKTILNSVLTRILGLGLCN